MKRLTVLLLVLFITCYSAAIAFGAGDCDTDADPISMTTGSPAGIVRITFTCVGDSSNGSVPNTAVPTSMVNYLIKERPYRLDSVIAYPTGIGTSSFIFVDGDVSVANNTIDETAHGYSTRDSIDLSTAGSLPGGLAAATTYYVIAVDADTISLATTKANALAADEVDITGNSGGGNHTLDANRPDEAAIFLLDANSMDLLGSVDGSTTAYNGLKLIHATLASATEPSIYIRRAPGSSAYFPLITGAMTLKTISQATARAVWTIVLNFVEAVSR